jgi:RHS repeat-associated protein
MRRSWEFSALGILSLTAFASNASAQGVVRVYDGANRLASETIGGQTVSYRYDGVGNLVVRCLGAACTDVMVSPDRRVLGEEGVANRVYAYGPSGVLANRSGAGLPNYALKDAHGSVLGQATPSGTLGGRTAYTAYGAMRVQSDSTALHYTGEYQDGLTQTLWLRARAYSPDSGRFVERDAYEGEASNGQSLNRYVYTENSPLMMTDPSGHKGEPDAIIFGGYAFGVEKGGKAVPGFGGGGEVQFKNIGTEDESMLVRGIFGFGRNREFYAGAGSSGATGIEFSLGGGVNQNNPSGYGVGGGRRWAGGINLEKLVDGTAVDIWSLIYYSETTAGGIAGLNHSRTESYYLDGTSTVATRTVISTDRSGNSLLDPLNAYLKGRSPGAAPPWYWDGRLAASVSTDFLAKVSSRGLTANQNIENELIVYRQMDQKFFNAAMARKKANPCSLNQYRASPPPPQTPFDGQSDPIRRAAEFVFPPLRYFGFGGD